MIASKMLATLLWLSPWIISNDTFSQNSEGWVQNLDERNGKRCFFFLFSCQKIISIRRKFEQSLFQWWRFMCWLLVFSVIITLRSFFTEKLNFCSVSFLEALTIYEFLYVTVTICVCVEFMANYCNFNGWACLTDEIWDCSFNVCCVIYFFMTSSRFSFLRLHHVSSLCFYFIFSFLLLFLLSIDMGL